MGIKAEYNVLRRLTLAPFVTVVYIRISANGQERERGSTRREHPLPHNGNFRGDLSLASLGNGAIRTRPAIEKTCVRDRWWCALGRGRLQGSGSGDAIEWRWADSTRKG